MIITIAVYAEREREGGGVVSSRGLNNSERKIFQPEKAILDFGIASAFSYSSNAV